jgi:hypothetical protein
MPLTLNRGIAKATYLQLLDASSDINDLSTVVTDKKRNNPRAMMLALVTDHPGMIKDPTARVVYKSDAHMQPWRKAGVTTGNLRFDAGIYNKQIAVFTALDNYAAGLPAGPAKVAAEAAAAAANPPPFDPNLDYTELMPDWDFELGTKLVV